MGPQVQNADDLATAGSAYRAAARAVAAADQDFHSRIDLISTAGEYAALLITRAAEGLEPVFERMYRDTALWRPAVADHVVWSTYDSRNRRQLHVWPRGDRYGDIGPYGHGSERATACGHEVFLDPANARSWRRARPGEWRDTLSADPMRICDACLGLAGDSDMVVERPGRLAGWERHQIASDAQSGLLSELTAADRGRGLVHSRARRRADELLATVEISQAAVGLRDLGPGAIRRILGAEAYEQPERCRHSAEIAGELMTTPRWEALLGQYIDGLSGQSRAATVVELLRPRVRDLLA